jgi:hypothetical protein
VGVHAEEAVVTLGVGPQQAGDQFDRLVLLKAQRELEAAGGEGRLVAEALVPIISRAGRGANAFPVA